MAGLRALARLIDAVNGAVGRTLAWLGLLLVMVQLAIVVGRYVFGVGAIRAQELMLYAHALLFMLTAAWTLREDGHVRVDVFYRPASPRRKALVNLVGTLVFLLPVCILTLAVSWGYVASSWAVREGSKEASGLPAVFLLKTAILVFAMQLALQGVSIAIHSILALRGDPDELRALAATGAAAPV